MRFTRFTNISPLDFRYLDAGIRGHLSEEKFIEYKLMFERSLAHALFRRGLMTEAVYKEIEAACHSVTPDEVYAEEERVGHDIRALVNCIRAKVSDAAKPFVHLTATSQDINDSANALRYVLTSVSIFIPELIELERTLISSAERTASLAQIGRTHGQHAIPTTFGFMIAGYVSRLGECIVRVDACVRELRGKFSGAVGSCNAAALLMKDPKAMEREILKEYDLEPAEHATQITPPEPLMRFFHETMLAVGIMADLADDMRHLARSEIREVREAFGPEQVGSSTMPQKRNPIRFERVKGFWKQVMIRQNLLLMDQLSEHQRDGTNFVSQRTYPEILAYAILATVELKNAMQTARVDQAEFARNLLSGQGSIAAEPLYIILASLGHPDAHEKVRQLTLRAEAEKCELYSVIRTDSDIFLYWGRMTDAQRNIVKNPLFYVGVASSEASAIAKRWRITMDELDAK
ncbi:MAG: adenylosuccinate lyase [Candidatus Niyogibacteria bacterium]|nr:adenylosuccinate lyase [Candidatus Niyogibacteria bacterium]